MTSGRSKGKDKTFCIKRSFKVSVHQVGDFVQPFNPHVTRWEVWRCHKMYNFASNHHMVVQSGQYWMCGQGQRRVSAVCEPRKAVWVSFIFPPDVQVCQPIKFVSRARVQVKCRYVSARLGSSVTWELISLFPGHMMPVRHRQAPYAFRSNETLHLWVFLIVGSSDLRSAGQNYSKTDYLWHRPLPTW